MSTATRLPPADNAAVRYKVEPTIRRVASPAGASKTERSAGKPGEPRHFVGLAPAMQLPHLIHPHQKEQRGLRVPRAHLAQLRGHGQDIDRLRLVEQVQDGLIPRRLGLGIDLGQGHHAQIIPQLPRIEPLGLVIAGELLFGTSDRF